MKEKSKYPLLFMPTNWFDLRKNLEPIRKLELPLEPQYSLLDEESFEEKYGIYGGCLLSIIGLALLVACARSVFNEVGPIALIGLILIVVGAYITNSLGDKSDAKFLNDVKDYDEKSDSYIRRLNEYGDYLERKEKRDELLKNDYKYICRYLVENKKFNINSEGFFQNASVGISEDFFSTYLENAFQDKILTGKCVQFSGGYEYYPDFIYVDTEKGVYLDIEIDEPYTFKSKKPIHYGEVDDERNKVFTSNYWSVIRFSESQILQYPKECVQTIESYVKYLMSEQDNMAIYVPTQLRWSEEGALAQIAIESRTSLLQKAKLLR